MDELPNFNLTNGKMKGCWIKIKNLYILLIKVRYITLVCFSLVIIDVSQSPLVVHCVGHFEIISCNYQERDDLWKDGI